MAYGMGVRINGMMKIAEVTTDTETGFLAFSAIMISGSVIDYDSGEKTQLLNVEPMELCYVSDRTKKSKVIWKFNFDKQGQLATKMKFNAIKRFAKENNADLIDIKKRLEMFVTNQFYEMKVDEIDAFVSGKEIEAKTKGKPVNLQETRNSKEMTRMARKVSESNEMKKLERILKEVRSKRFDIMRERARLN